MAKRYIGIELDGETARIALLTEDGGNLSFELSKQAYGSPDEAREVLSGLTGGARALGDHLVTALPASGGFFRSLNFPFKDRSKLASVLPSELDSQVPISLENYTCAMQSPRERDGGDYTVDAAAVSNESIETLLEHFPDPAQHPRRIDLMPHALAGGFEDKDGLLVYCGRQETQVALIMDGHVAEFRLLPSTGGVAEEEIGRFVLNQLRQLEQLSGRQDLPFWACGSAVSEALLDLWRESGRPPAAPELMVNEQDVPAEYLPAVLLALSERSPARQNGFNFRIGPYAPQGQLEMLKKKLVAAGVLLLLCLMIVVGTGYFDYHRKARQADLLKQQLEEAFHQILPQATAVFDVPLQLQSHLKELRQQALLLGVGDQVTALKSLETLSSQIGPEIKTDLKEMSYNNELIKLDGYTDSFESVNRITQAVNRSPLFFSVEISDARMAADASRVDFQLQIVLSKSGGGL